jgi:D-tyrosyl-tRNA(Tyr) deacylase
MVLVCAERGDSEREADLLLGKLLGYRVFADDAGKMNRSVTDMQGGLLLVPQFTLAADTKSGTRPSFTPAASPADGERLFAYFARQARLRHPQVETGRFGADMKVSLTNDGPVTFWLQVAPRPPQ